MTTAPQAPSPPPVKQTWMPAVAAILTIIAGASEILGGILVGFFDTIMRLAFFDLSGVGFFFGLPAIMLGVVAIIGGIYASRRQAWGMALAGAICALFLPHVSVLGILAIIFIALSKQEFS